MNVDRLPDGRDDDPERPTETPRLTEATRAETPPPPEASQPKEDPQATESPEATKYAVHADDSLEGPDTTDPPPDQAEAQETAEPRSRQEHADQPPADESAGEVDAGAADQNADPTTESPDEVPDSADVIAEATDDEIEMAFAREEATESPMSDRGPNREDATGEEEKGAEELSEQEDLPSGDAEDSRPVDEAPPGDDAPAEDDRILPLTDKEWAEHLTEVRDSLDKARAAGLTTDRLYTINGAGEIWSSEREVMHDSIINDFYARSVNVPCNFKALIAGGLGGAGKTTVLAEHASIDHSQYLVINPDDIKEEMARRDMLPEIEGVSPMEASDLAHEESSHIAKRLAHRAQADGKNLIWDITMSSKESTVGRIQALQDAGYGKVDGLFVKISTETSIRRTESRHREGHDKWRTGEGLGGRFVPPEVIERQNDPEWGSRNRKTYEEVKERFNAWSIYDNSIDGHPPSLVESSDSANLQQDNGRRFG